MKFEKGDLLITTEDDVWMKKNQKQVAVVLETTEQNHFSYLNLYFLNATYLNNYLWGFMPEWYEKLT